MPLRTGCVCCLASASSPGVAAPTMTVRWSAGLPTTSFYSEADHRAWCSKMIGRDILVDRPFFSTLAHTPQHVEETLAAAEAIHDMQI